GPGAGARRRGRRAPGPPPRRPDGCTMDAVRAPYGPILAIGSAVLFGASTPLAKLLLRDVDPWMLAGLLYLGSGAGLALLLGARRLAGRAGGEASLGGVQWLWLALAILLRGGLRPRLLMD